MDLSKIRRLVIVAMFSDDRLLHQLALKGGNALNLVYNFGSRASIDVDLSLETDFEDVEETKGRIFRALRSRFAENGYTVFDEQLEPQPALDVEIVDERWGGYDITFKLMERLSPSSGLEKTFLLAPLKNSLIDRFASCSLLGDIVLRR